MPHTLIFIHVPKTGGSSFLLTLPRQFGPEESFQFIDPRELGRSPELVEHFGSFEDFFALPAEIRNGFRCIFGHFNYGLHEHLANEASYMVFFRNPVERVISQYHHAQRRLREDSGDPEVRLDPVRWVSENRGVLNAHARFVSAGRFLNRQLERHSFEENLGFAKSILNRDFTMLGVMERFEESLALLKLRMGWDDVSVARVNIGNRPRSEDEFEPEHLNYLRDNQRLDFELHRFANQWLDNAIAEEGARFEAALKELRESSSQ